MKGLKLEELTLRQRIGMTMTAYAYDNDAELDYLESLIKDHSLGAVWVTYTIPGRDKVIKRIKDAADYPILIMTDAESGIEDKQIGFHVAMALTGREELAYTFGKVVAVTARNIGYNVICNPLLDMTDCNVTCSGTIRTLGQDKVKVSSLAAAEAQGMHDGGVLTVGKHYPGRSTADKYIDSHMAETWSDATKEELLDYNLYPYKVLMDKGLLDGIMTGHSLIKNVDDKYPTSVSEKVIGIIREQGFDGFAITDALVMMGIVAKFGRDDCIGLSIAHGNDLSLPFRRDNKSAFDAMMNYFERGLISEDRINEAARRVIEAQNKTLAEPKFTELCENDLELFEAINRDSVYQKLDDGVSDKLSKDGRHYFAVLTETAIDLNDLDKVEVDTLGKEWFNPVKIAEKIKSLFPNSMVRTVTQFPTPTEVCRLLNESVEYEDVVFVTYFNTRDYVGIEALTTRVTSMMTALQVTDRISALLHFGNPFVLEDVPHIPRVIVGAASAKTINTAFDILAGDYTANGVLPYEVRIK